MTFRISYYFGIKALYILIDVLCVVLSVFAACALNRALLPFPVDFYALFVDQENPFRVLLLMWVVVTVFCASANRLYETRREQLEALEIWKVIKCVFISAFVVAMSDYILKLGGLPRTVWLEALVFNCLLLAFWRVLKRMFVQYLVSRGYNNFRVLIIGAGRVGISLAEEIRRRPGLGLKVVGFLDDFKKGDKNARILGRIADFDQVFQREFINKVFITVYHDSDFFIDLMAEAKSRGIAVHVIPHGFDLIVGELFRYNIGIIPVLEYADLSNFRRQMGKRIFDLLASAAALLILIPVFAVIAVKIRLDSPGPVFYRSKRYGRRGKIFYMLKFRTMVRDADKQQEDLKKHNEADGPIFKIRNDPRITPLGAILRRYSLDELPQFWNVFIGDMSLVGPRPLPIEQIEQEDLRQFKRLEVRPGITGLWQVRGRSDVSFARLIRWDIWYINNWSFWLDLNILAQTVPVMLKGKGAY